MNSTTRLTTYKEEETHSNVYYLFHFTVFSHTAFFPKIVPIVQERDNFFSVAHRSQHTHILALDVLCKRCDTNSTYGRIVPF